MSGHVVAVGADPGQISKVAVLVALAMSILSSHTKGWDDLPAWVVCD